MANELDEAALSAIEARAEKAKPWLHNANAQLKSALDVPPLIATIRSLRAEIERLQSTRQRGLVIISVLINFIDWLNSEGVVQLSERKRGELVKQFLDAHQEGENYFLQAEQVAEILGVPFQKVDG